ncbi:MAG: MFS transporter [Cytophagales bacterium]|nr:MFS transporter [Cytophagales bacterium]MDW8383807.1 VC0807 family protein [Flammeovirgaceae bacterium]
MPRFKKQNGIWLSIVFNILVPSLILMKFSSPDRLGTLYALMLALAFPIGFGLYEFFIQKNKDVLVLVGILSTLITGIIGLFELDGFWIAVKESIIPLIFGLILGISPHTPYFLLKKMLYNSGIINISKLEWALNQYGTQKEFNRHLRISSYLLATSFLLSSILNFALARAIVTSAPGTPEFNEEIGKMTALSYPVIVVPSLLLSLLVVYYIFYGIKKYTNFSINEIIQTNS